MCLFPFRKYSIITFNRHTISIYIFHWSISAQYYTLRFQFPYLSLLAHTVNNLVYLQLVNISTIFTLYSGQSQHNIYLFHWSISIQYLPFTLVNISTIFTAYSGQKQKHIYLLKKPKQTNENQERADNLYFHIHKHSYKIIQGPG